MTRNYHAAAAGLPHMEEIVQGALALDSKRRDWFDVVYPMRRELDLSSSSLCVLGLLFGDYWTGLAHLQISGPEAVRLGFALGGSNHNIYRDYDGLTQEWRDFLDRLAEQLPQG